MHLPHSNRDILTSETASFTWARPLKDGRTVPQAIAHRGYKAAFPENTMAAFIGAVNVGAHALETDLHLSSDGVVVLSHDANLRRCFGKEEKIIDCNWEFLSTLRTTQTHEPMPRLLDLLQYLAEPGMENIWVLLDIKLDNNANDIMRLIASTIYQVPPSPSRPWNQRIVLGCWATKYLPLAHKYLPDYPITHIGFSTTYSRQFLSVPNISFNTLQQVLIGPFGARFIKAARNCGRPVFSWTVNAEKRMRWCIRHNLDGVCTDDPKRFLELCKDFENGALAKKESFTWREWLDILRFQVLALVFLWLFKWKFGWGIDKKFIQRAVAAQQKRQVKR
ncbi:PLC-like phosphodiesterase [Tothia fuscella]|uniref:PLC-like phosphodiesterase n=1 Tax=Tothia fuscella TaxID=1048955 RepID=A0A9P4TW94_9PEZI|nr:PLC-like phosphodiesterase [Tothia fuscella]